MKSNLHRAQFFKGSLRPAFWIILGLGAVILSAAIIPFYGLLPVSLILGFFILVLSIKSPFIILTLIVFLIPLEGFTTVEGASLNRYLSIPLAIGWLFKKLRKETHFPKYEWQIWLIIGYVLLAGISRLWATGRLWSSLFPGLILSLLILLTTIDLTNSQRRLNLLISSLLSGMLIYVAIWFLSGSLVLDAYYIPLVGVSGISQYGNMLGAIMACMIAWSLKSNPKFMWIALVSMSFITYLIFSIGLRRNFVTSLVVLAGMVIFSRSRRIHNFIYLIALALLIFQAWQVLLPLLPQTIQDRLTIQAVIDSQGTGRIPIFQLAYDVWLEHRIFGVGFGDFGYHSMQSPITSYRPISAMNNFLLSLTELGIFGFLLWTAFWVGICFVSWTCYISPDLREQERLANGIQFALVLFFLSGMMIDPFINFRLMWLAMGLPIVVQRIKLINNPDTYAK